MKPRAALFLAFLALSGCATRTPPGEALPVRVLLRTEEGGIVLEVDTVRAPITAANFLRYVEAGRYDGGLFHRTVRADNQPQNPVKIGVVQAGVNPGLERRKENRLIVLLRCPPKTPLGEKQTGVAFQTGASRPKPSASSAWAACLTLRDAQIRKRSH